MPYVAGVTAFQVRHPVIVIVLMEASNCPFQKISYATSRRTNLNMLS